MSEDGVEVGGIVGRARRWRWDVDAVDIEWMASEMDFNRDNFQFIVGGFEGRNVDGEKFDIVVNKNADAAAAVNSRAVTTSERIVPERDGSGGFKLSLL